MAKTNTPPLLTIKELQYAIDKLEDMRKILGKRKGSAKVVSEIYRIDNLLGQYKAAVNKLAKRKQNLHIKPAWVQENIQMVTAWIAQCKEKEWMPYMVFAIDKNRTNHYFVNPGLDKQMALNYFKSLIKQLEKDVNE
jgi:hypothetical protein